MTIEQKTKSLTPEQLAEWQLIDAEWMAGFNIPGIGAIPPHARLEGYFAGEPTEPEKAPHVLYPPSSRRLGIERQAAGQPARWICGSPGFRKVQPD